MKTAVRKFTASVPLTATRALALAIGGRMHVWQAALDPTAGATLPTTKLLDRPRVQVLVVALALVFVLFARRYAQMLDPQVWDEEGIIVSQLVAHGPASLFDPLNGYLILLPRLICFAALLVPFGEYPRTATMLTWTAIVAILLAVSFVPSRLRGGPLLAVTALLVPSDPEVFGIPLYAFWWTIPLLYASYFWRTGSQLSVWRIVAIVLAGLSAPAILMAGPLFALRALVKRTRDEIAAGIAAIACMLVQLAALAQTHTHPVQPTLASIVPTVRKLLGAYQLWNIVPTQDVRDVVALACGILTLVVVTIAIACERDLRAQVGVLLFLWLGSAVLTTVRVDMNIIDPVVDGPRYFFLAFVAEGWIFVQIALGARNRTLRWTGAAVLLCAVFNALPVLSRTHADLAWKASVAACAATSAGKPYGIPIQADGRLSSHWTLSLSGRDCRILSRFGLTGLLFADPPGPD